MTALVSCAIAAAFTPCAHSICLSLPMRAVRFAFCFASPATADSGFRWVAEPAFHAAAATQGGVEPLQQGGLWGLLGLNGQWLFPPQFEAVGAGGMRVFAVRQGSKCGLVNLRGEVVADYERWLRIMNMTHPAPPATYAPPPIPRCDTMVRGMRLAPRVSSTRRRCPSIRCPAMTIPAWPAPRREFRLR